MNEEMRPKATPLIVARPSLFGQRFVDRAAVHALLKYRYLIRIVQVNDMSEEYNSPRISPLEHSLSPTNESTTLQSQE